MKQEEKSYEVVFTCRSINNKKVRANELNILEKNEKGLFFVFGENNVNAKKRYYNDLKTLNEDFEQLKKIKDNLKKDKNNLKNSKNNNENYDYDEENDDHRIEKFKR